MGSNGVLARTRSRERARLQNAINMFVLCCRLRLSLRVATLRYVYIPNRAIYRATYLTLLSSHPIETPQASTNPNNIQHTGPVAQYTKPPERGFSISWGIPST